MSAGDEGFFAQFIDDYFAECDEHLATTRRALLAIEASVRDTGQPPPDATLVRELFRSLHTLKGLAGMVGDACAEKTAHALEEALRGMERAGSAPTARMVDALFAGVEMLDRCVAARRAGEPEPDAEAVTTLLARVASASGEASGRPSSPTPNADAGSTELSMDDSLGANTYRFAFAPSPGLRERGVGVDSVRARLGALGRVLEAKPRMAAGVVVFDFRVEVAGGRRPDDAWSADGLSWEIETPAVDAAPSPSSIEPAALHGARAASAANVVRVDLARVDAVMRLVGDLLTARNRLDGLLRHPDGPGARATVDALEETNAVMERKLRQLREGVMRLRLVPVGEVFERLRFAARDAVRESGKRVAVAVRGESTEIDKLVVDRMLEPLLHLVRNAVGHGIERPERRIAEGKPPEGTLTLRATAAGDRIVIEVEDDGAGIDADRTAARARERGLLADEESVGPERLLELICAPGFSTRDEADLTSGRGVGMEVVLSTVRALGGTLEMSTTPGRGTRFVIELPLTLMIVDALLVEIGGQLMAMPQPVLREIVQIARSEIVTFESNEVVSYRGGVLPLVGLSDLFRLPPSPREAAYLLVVGSEDAPIGLMVDRLIELREIVVHPVTDPLVTMPGVGGATDLGDGRVCLILDAAALVRLAHERRDQRSRARTPNPASGAQRRPRASHLSA